MKPGIATDDVPRRKENFCLLSEGKNICNATSSRINMGTDRNDLQVTIKYDSSHMIYPLSQDLKERGSGTISINSVQLSGYLTFSTSHFSFCTTNQDRPTALISECLSMFR